LFELDYGAAAALGVVFVVPAFAAWGRAFRGKSALQERYQERRASALASISGSHVVPLVARLVVTVHPRIDWPLFGNPGTEHTEAVESLLQSVPAKDELDKLIPLDTDAADCKRLQDEVKRWLWGQAWSVAPYVPCAAFLIAKASSDGMEVPNWLYWLAALICSCALCVWATFFGLEIAARNRMADIFRRYE
jgi:hypothetical protein